MGLLPSVDICWLTSGTTISITVSTPYLRFLLYFNNSFRTRLWEPKYADFRYISKSKNKKKFAKDFWDQYNSKERDNGSIRITEWKMRKIKDFTGMAEDHRELWREIPVHLRDKWRRKGMTHVSSKGLLPSGYIDVFSKGLLLSETSSDCTRTV